MEDHASNQLHIKGPEAQYPLGRLSNHLQANLKFSEMPVTGAAFAQEPAEMHLPVCMHCGADVLLASTQAMQAATAFLRVLTESANACCSQALMRNICSGIRQLQDNRMSKSARLAGKLPYQ